MNPVGPLDHPIREVLDPADDPPFAVAGRRSCVTGGAGRGVDQVRVHPWRLARGPRLAGAVCKGATITPLGLERRLRAHGVGLLERVVVPRDAPFALFEWQAEEDGASVDIEWSVEADADWRRDGHTLLVSPAGTGARAAFVFSEALEGVEVEPTPPDPAGTAARVGVRLEVRVRVPVRPGTGLRLAMVAAGDDTALERALRAARRTDIVVQARRGAVERLIGDRLGLSTPDPAMDRAVEALKVQLEGRLVEIPGVGRSLVGGYGPGAPVFRTADGVAGALDALLAGDFPTARDVLLFLGRHQRPTGLVPESVPACDEPAGGDFAATLLYLHLAGEYHAWTGDSASLRNGWTGLRAALEHVGRPGQVVALDRLVHLAEALGDARAADWLRQAPRPPARGGPTSRVHHPGAADGPSGEGFRAVRELLGVEPDAARSRLTLRPRPPAAWDHFQVRGLAMGDAAFALSYLRKGRLHRFVVRQDRGPTPATLVLEAVLPGPLRAARVDGAPADLTMTEVEEGWLVPVQLALDDERTVELEGDQVFHVSLSGSDNET